MENENELSEPSSSNNDSSYRVGDDYLSHAPDSFFVTNSSHPQYFINQNVELEHNEASSVSFNDDNRLFALEESYSQQNVNSSRLSQRPPNNPEFCQSVQISNQSSNPRISYMQGGYITQPESSQEPDHSLDLSESLPSTSKGYYKKNKTGKKILRDNYRLQESVYPDSNLGERHRVESTQDRVHISPFKKRLSSKHKLYLYASSESDDDAGLDLTSSLNSGANLGGSFSKKNIYIEINDDSNRATTSVQGVRDDLNRDDYFHPNNAGDSCLVSSSTGHLDSPPPSLQDNHIDQLSHEDSQNQSLLDFTVDSTSGQNISSPYSNKSDGEEIDEASDKIFRVEYEDSRGEISTSMSHMEDVDNPDMELLSVKSKSFTLKNEHGHVSLENFSPNASVAHAGIIGEATSHDVAASLPLPSSSYFDSEQLAIPGPSGVNKPNSLSCTSADASLDSPFVSDSMDLTVNSAPSQSTLNRYATESLNQEAIGLEMADIEPESTNFATPAHLDGDYVLRNSDSMTNLQRGFSSKTLNQLNQPYLLEIGENSFVAEMNSDYASPVKKEDMLKESTLEIGDSLNNPLEIEEEESVSHNLQAIPYDLVLDSHLKKYLPNREVPQNLLSHPGESAQIGECNELPPLECHTPSKSSNIQNQIQASSFDEMHLVKHEFYGGDAISSCINPTFDENENCAIDFRTKTHSSDSATDRRITMSTPKKSYKFQKKIKIEMKTEENSNLGHSSYGEPIKAQIIHDESTSLCFSKSGLSKFVIKPSTVHEKAEIEEHSIDALPNTIINNCDSEGDGEEPTISSFWCDECGELLKDKCLLHKVQTISDKPILNRAWASLPCFHLSIKQVSLEEPDTYGVFAKRMIPKRTQFGPLQGNFSKESSTSGSLSFPVLKEHKIVYIDTSEPETSNWMRFVRRADNYLDMNCVVIEEAENIYFLTAVDIRPKIELRIGYSKQYAIKYGLVYLSPSKEEQEVLDSVEKTWSCYECDQAFRTSAELQGHLNAHDEKPPDKKFGHRRRKRGCVKRIKTSLVS